MRVRTTSGTNTIQYFVWFRSSSVAKITHFLTFPQNRVNFKLCNTTPPKPYNILNHVLFPDEVLSLTGVYVPVKLTFVKSLIGEATKFMTNTIIRASLYKRTDPVSVAVPSVVPPSDGDSDPP